MCATLQETPSDLIEVAVALPIFTTFTYRVPSAFMDRITLGARVLVPFGRRRITGYVVALAVDPPDFPLKEIKEVLDERPLFSDCMLPFFKWVANYYLHPLGEVIQGALPSGINVKEQAHYSLGEAGHRVLSEGRLENWEKSVLQHLSETNAPIRAGSLQRAAGGALSKRQLDAWEKKEWVVKHQALTGGRTRPKTARFVRIDTLPSTETRLSASRRSIVDILSTLGEMAVSDLKTMVPTADSLVRAMAKDGQVAIVSRSVYRDPFGAPITPDQPPELTEEQQSALQTMETALGSGYQTFLLHGVTGSGKTEIYLQMAARAMAKGMSVLVLVPEIALISQTESAFRARFGDCVALLHSGLSNGERLDQWQRIQCGEATIAVGARSAIFAPFDNIGLLIVDEEHDDSYKQEGALRYNARDLAVVRAKQLGAVAILGSATPSLQSAYNAEHGKFQKIALYERVDRQVLPSITIKDLTAIREERGVRRFLTPALLSAMEETLARNEQVLIFLNRRGFASTLVCADCGQALRCDHCDISLTYHQKDNAYRCHYCGFSRASVTRCGRCGSQRINRLGIGTEQLTEQLRQRFPAARISRMDRDTTRRKGSLVKILKALRDRKIDILVGTQMVAKGHDYPHITLVGIICADLSLSMPDFRAGERTFQLLAQVAGRAGRGKTAGRVILQTYNPMHYSIEAARDQDFEAFYRQEMQFRKVLQYPPFTRMIQVRVSSPEKRHAADLAGRIGAAAKRLIGEKKEYSHMEVLGPIEAPLQRIADQYRWQMLVKGNQVNAMHHLVHDLLLGPTAVSGKADTAIAVDVDPLFLM